MAILSPRRRTLRNLLICAGILFAFSGGARASCSNFINFGQQGPYCSGGSTPCFWTSPGFGASASLRGTFWALGHGNPALGAGVDNGGWDLAAWLQDKPNGFKIKGNWFDFAIDGCIDDLAAPEVMVVEMSDRALLGEAGYFAVAAVERGSPLDLNQFDFAVGIGENIELAPIPPPTMSLIPAPGGYTGLYFDYLDIEELEPGFYSDGSVEMGDVIVGRRIYISVRSRYAPPASGRLRSEWQAATPILGFSGTSIQFSCQDYFLATVEFTQTLVFDSGFETEYVSANSIAANVCNDCGYDADFDGWCDKEDCAEFNWASPRWYEWNDPFDNRCDGLYNEMEPQLAYYYPGDKDRLSWRLQGQATQYEILRSESPDFLIGCTSATSDTAHWSDPELPLPGGKPFHYLVRALAPYAGSLGRSSSGDERIAACP